MKKLIIFIIIIIGLFAVMILINNKTNRTDNIPGNLDSLQTGTYPWGIATTTLRARLKAINLPALKEEGTVLHIHQHLDLYIDGKSVAIPEGIGVNDTAGFIAPIHTHDTTGIIHVESPVVQDFTLGQFFNIWGVQFSDQCIGGYCNTDTKKLQVYVNGQKIENNFQNIKLEAHQELAIIYGDPASLPNPIPATYTFPPEY